MAMKLYGSDASPFVRKVRVLAIETGQMEEIEEVKVGGTPTDPGSLPLEDNPLGKIPTLVVAGEVLYDSRVICRFLDHRAGGRLYPPVPRLWRTLTLEATADGILEAAVLMVYEKRVRPPEKWFEPWVEAQWAKIERALRVLCEKWLPHLTGPVDMGHVAVGCALGYLDFRHPDRDWRARRPGLASWYDEFAQRPSMVATAPPAG